VLEEPDLAALVATLERLDSRPPILTRAEAFFWRQAAGQLRRASWMDFFYWRARYYFVHGGRESWAVTLLEQALLCGEARTVREYAERYLENCPPLGDPRKIAEGVARLHQRTGSDGELLARVEARLGQVAYASPEALRLGVRHAAIECSLIFRRTD
jgi:hypothetical protein